MTNKLNPSYKVSIIGIKCYYAYNKSGNPMIWGVNKVHNHLLNFIMKFLKYIKLDFKTLETYVQDKGEDKCIPS